MRLFCTWPDILVVPGLFLIPKTSLLLWGVYSNGDKANVTCSYDRSGSLFFHGELTVLACLPLGRCCQCQWKWFLKRRGKHNHNCWSGPTLAQCVVSLCSKAHSKYLCAGLASGDGIMVTLHKRMDNLGWIWLHVTYITCKWNVQLHRDKSNKWTENMYVWKIHLKNIDYMEPKPICRFRPQLLPVTFFTFSHTLSLFHCGLAFT